MARDPVTEIFGRTTPRSNPSRLRLNPAMRERLIVELAARRLAQDRLQAMACFDGRAARQLQQLRTT